MLKNLNSVLISGKEVLPLIEGGKGVAVSNGLSSGKPGSIHKFDASGIYINTGDKVIVITDLQFPNKNIISSKDAFNSYKNFFV